MLRPLLKWPGGKSRELDPVRALAGHDLELLVEPFVGGGACLFALEPERAIINDANSDLIGLYQAVADDYPEARQAFRRMASVWDRALGRVSKALAPRLAAAFVRERDRIQVAAARNAIVDDMASSLERFDRRYSAPFVGHGTLYRRFRASLVSKMTRLRSLERKHAMEFAEADLPQHFETALRGGFYTCVRDDFEPQQGPPRLARFFFIREYCYGSMFRFNREGKFNIPYGGMNYNNKRLGPKVERLFGTRRIDLLRRTTIHCGDFRAFFRKYESRFGPGTFVFIDPPYDSDFSEYARMPFTLEDQKGLAEIVGSLAVPFAVIIRDTPAIRELYQRQQERCRKMGRSLYIHQYPKTYTYNVRGRNARHVTHLLIHNVATAGRQLVLPF